MMTADYYIQEPSAEWEAVERWENEGGRLGQRHHRSHDSIGEAYLRHMEQAFPSRRLGEPNHIARRNVLTSTRRTTYRPNTGCGWQANFV